MHVSTSFPLAAAWTQSDKAVPILVSLFSLHAPLWCAQRRSLPHSFTKAPLTDQWAAKGQFSCCRSSFNELSSVILQGCILGHISVLEISYCGRHSGRGRRNRIFKLMTVLVLCGHEHSKQKMHKMIYYWPCAGTEGRRDGRTDFCSICSIWCWASKKRNVNLRPYVQMYLKVGFLHCTMICGTLR